MTFAQFICICLFLLTFVHSRNFLVTVKSKDLLPNKPVVKADYDIGETKDTTKDHKEKDDNIISLINLRPKEEVKIKKFLNKNADVKAELMNVTSAYIAYLKRDLETYEISSHIDRPISLSKMVNDLRKETRLFGQKLLKLFSPVLKSIPKLKQLPKALQGIIDTIMDDHEEKMKKLGF